MSKNNKKFIPYDKASKQEKKQRDKARRTRWEIKPVTQVIPDKKKEYKKKNKRDDYYEDYGDDY